jgi:bacterioferritin-associated ferredoxin
MTLDANSTGKTPLQRPAERGVDTVCACVDLTRSALDNLLAREPNLSFDDMLRRTGAGTTCTACLLDLEYLLSEHAVAAPDRRGNPVAATMSKTRRSLKRRLYDVVDAVAPLWPVRLSNPMPILAAPGIEQFLCVANDSMFYKGEFGAPPMTVRLLVRDAAGRVRHRAEHRVAPEDALWVNLSEHLPEAPRNGLPAIGSVEITRIATRPGTRGTTRPQVVIRATAGSCAVHSQAAGEAREKWVTCIYRPTEERVFVSCLNAADRTLNGVFEYPHGLPGIEATTHDVSVPPFGTILYEIALPAGIALDENPPYGIRLQFDGRHKCHLLCATPALDRFSIDHL